MTVPVWISAAAAFVTAGVTRLVAPVSSSGPNGDAFTRVLQSDCAKALPEPGSRASDVSATATIRVLILMGSSLGSEPAVLRRFLRLAIMTGQRPGINPVVITGHYG